MTYFAILREKISVGKYTSEIICSEVKLQQFRKSVVRYIETHKSVRQRVVTKYTQSVDILILGKIKAMQLYKQIDVIGDFGKYDIILVQYEPLNISPIIQYYILSLIRKYNINKIIIA